MPRPGINTLLALVILVAVSVSIPLTITMAQVSEDEARSTFERLGCISCHNGQVAASWDEMVNLFESWKGKYTSLDEAVKAEIEYFGGQKFNSYNELVQTMANNVGRSPDDPEVRMVFQYLESLFGVEQAQTTEPPKETTPTPTETMEEREEPVTPTVTGVRGGEEPAEGVVLTIISIAAIVVIAVVAAVYLTRR
ncbi:MAG: hypothetical protein GSR85_11330 [Desulfurococcales archaeon]|nr:hypothetical protein [Desulfurococcales archaeon]